MLEKFHLSWRKNGDLNLRQTLKFVANYIYSVEKKVRGAYV